MKHQWSPRGYGPSGIANGWLGATMKCALLAPGFAYDPDNNATWASISASEVPAGGLYVAGGVTLTGKTAVYNPAADRYDLDANDVAWGAVGGPYASFTAAAAVIYESGGGALWSFIDFEGSKVVANGVFTVQFDPNGVLYMQALAPV